MMPAAAGLSELFCFLPSSAGTGAWCELFAQQDVLYCENSPQDCSGFFPGFLHLQKSCLFIII